MIFKETDCIELKRQYTDDLRKEVVAFANTRGGTIYLGVNDDGSVVGVDDTDKTILQITSSCLEGIKPDLSLFLKCATVEAEGKNIIRVDVQKGPERPYFLLGKGLKPSGVFSRVGTVSVPVSLESIRTMIKESDGDSFEDMRSLEQSLTFHTAEALFNQKNLPFGDPQKKSLGLLGEDDLYTNLALLLSDQCPHMLKGAIFQTSDQSEFQDRKEFTGSLFKQLEEAYSYLEQCNRLKATFRGLYRKDTKDYPEVALREALLNAVIHKDYTRPVPTIISIYTDRVEMISYGNLANGISLEDALEGLSSCRNPKLAAIFYRLQLVEAYGTGLQKIRNSYEGAERHPQFHPLPNSFKVILPNRNTPKEPQEAKRGQASFRYQNFDSVEETTLLYLKENGNASRKDIQKATKGSPATTVRVLHRLKEKGLIQSVGNGKNTRYILSD